MKRLRQRAITKTHPPPRISTNIFLTIRLTASSLAGSHSLDVETLILVVVVSDSLCPSASSLWFVVWGSFEDGGEEWGAGAGRGIDSFSSVMILRLIGHASFVSRELFSLAQGRYRTWRDTTRRETRRRDVPKVLSKCMKVRSSTISNWESVSKWGMTSWIVCQGGHQPWSKVNREDVHEVVWGMALSLFRQFAGLGWRVIGLYKLSVDTSTRREMYIKGVCGNNGVLIQAGGPLGWWLVDFFDFFVHEGQWNTAYPTRRVYVFLKMHKKNHNPC